MRRGKVIRNKILNN
jgi:hypothetical protein